MQSRTKIIPEPYHNTKPVPLLIDEDTPLLCGSSKHRSSCVRDDFSPREALHITCTGEHERSTNLTKTSSLRSPSASLSTVNDFQNDYCQPNCGTEDDNVISDPLCLRSPDVPVCQSRNILPDGVSLRLENSGSVARDHLALERTFLAYIRTSLAIASAGIALIQLFSAAQSSTKSPTIILSSARYVRPLGASAVVIGLATLIIGVVRYFTVQSALTKGYFPVARISTGFIAMLLTALVTLTFSALIVGKLTHRGT